ncbi:hypothetical protein LF817_16230 [Halobacillus sp. A1]|uniref:hypothetical protein n=1 Tax=Halobacillus sp. A1 TaxID=2880262 RepID=UPI0020A62A75|nr:hypothetical protein [Halobacillus sp. A1]MCP3032875.1 hypothetical protein [Halobacillus sp. A1]
MTYEEAVEVLETMEDLYHGKFKLTKRRVQFLIPLLEKMEFDGVMGKLFNHASAYPFPPTIADIAHHLPEQNENLEQVKQWEEEAAKVPEEVKLRFEEMFEELVRKVSS